MSDIVFLDKDELEYDLSDIGLQDYFLCIEPDITYIYNNDEGYIEIPSDINSIITIKSENEFIFRGEDCFLVCTKEQFLIILEILQKK